MYQLKGKTLINVERKEGGLKVSPSKFVSETLTLEKTSEKNEGVNIKEKK
jgi:hypothetical protein